MTNKQFCRFPCSNDESRFYFCCYYCPIRTREECHNVCGLLEGKCEYKRSLKTLIADLLWNTIV